MHDDPMKQMGNRELEFLLPPLAETMKFAVQALAQSRALADILIAKGIVTQAELDAAMTSGRDLKENLLNVLDQQIKKQS